MTAPLVVLPPGLWTEVVTDRLVDVIADRPAAVICLPTGHTPLPIYDALPQRLRERGVSTRAVTIVALDEFLGLPAGHVARCDATLRRRLIDRLDDGVRDVITFDVDGAAPATACRRYDDAIAAAGGLDLVVLGLGRNGHVGMNEPGSPADAPTRMVELAATTREASLAYGADRAPTHGVTLGLAGIGAARAVWLLATGDAKRRVVDQLLEGPPGDHLPASHLLGHPGLWVALDTAASGAG